MKKLSYIVYVCRKMCITTNFVRIKYMINGLRNASFHIIDRINPRLPHQPSTPVSALGHSALVPRI